MKILLLGGTGAMGNHLAALLTEKGYEVSITSRSSQMSKDNIRYLQGNAKELIFLKNILNDKWDAIVDFMVYNEEEFKQRVDIFLEATTHYIFLSSARVYDQSEIALTEASDRLLDSSKDKEFLATSEYSLSKARQENILYSSGKKNWTIIRPYITYSVNRLQLGTLEKENWLYRALNGRTIVFSEDMINKTTTMTYGLDVAKGIVSILSKSNAFGKAYHITSENSHEWSEILNIYLDALQGKLGYRPNVIYQNLRDFSNWNPEKYQIIYDRLFDRKFDNTESKTFIDTEGFIDAQTGLKNCINDFIKDPKFLRINWKNEAIKDKLCDERTPLKEILGYKQKIKYLLFRYL